MNCRYGEPYPSFYEGTLEEALGEACHKPAKDVRNFSKLFFNANLSNEKI